jgi:hypothetical protein
MAFRPAMRGAAGLTHCGCWRRGPAKLWRSRLVCTEPAGHQGLHFSRWSGYEWGDDGGTPRRRKGRTKG